MKRYKIFLALILSLILATGCSKDFLEPEQTNVVTEDKKNELLVTAGEKLINSYLGASYGVLQGYWSSHDDFGLKAFQLGMDLYGEDIEARANWFTFDYLFDNFEAGYRRSNSTWNQFYEIISNSNQVLSGFEDVTNFSESEKILLMQAYALRGIAYFHLVNFYQATYKGAESKLGVPITTKPGEDKLARATVKEVYDQIVKDLSTAVEMGSYTPNNGDADKAVAAAYLAKAYAVMEDWPNVEKYAKIASAVAKDNVITYPSKWHINNPDVLWGFDVTAETSTSWASFYAHVDPTIRFYAGNGQAKFIYGWLYEQMGENDTRRTLYINKKDNPEILAELLKTDDNPNGPLYFYTELTSIKFMTQEAAITDYIFIRVQDPMLLEIEALIEQNKLADAAQKLNAFVQKRDPDFVAAANQSELREQYRIQRRIELWGEGTHRLDMRRWKQKVDRTKYFAMVDGKKVYLSHSSAPFVKDLNSPENIFKLPQREINNNPELVQN